MVSHFFSKAGGRAAAVLVLAAALMPALVRAQDSSWSDARWLVANVQQDVRRAQDFARRDASGSDRDNYRACLKHLSDFDRNLARNHFDKDRLDDSIGDIQRILDHNSLSPRGRNILQRDVDDLRRLRQDYDNWRDRR